MTNTTYVDSDGRDAEVQESAFAAPPLPYSNSSSSLDSLQDAILK